MIAFAYVQTGPKMAAMYAALADGLVANIRSVMPGEQILMLTDDATPIVKGIHHVMRIDRTGGLMTWRLKAHQMAHSMAEEILFTEPDVRFVSDVSKDFREGFDVAVTSREEAVRLAEDRINVPYTLGMTFSRNAEFWREAKLYCQKLDAKDQDWFGDMLSIAQTIEGGKFKVSVLDGAVYNHIVNDPSEPTDAKVLHYKGKRKAWLFPLVKEGAPEGEREAA